MNAPTHIDANKELRGYINSEKAATLPRFFKTGKGEYGEGDKFLGIVVPNIRKVAKQFKDLDLEGVKSLLHSEWHEERMLALLILVERFSKYPNERKNIFDFYLSSTRYINNWDLVDLSASDILGRYIYLHRELTPTIMDLSRSKRLFDRRISVISTFYFIKKGEAEPALYVISELLSDQQDLIQKASGWMLREIWSRVDQAIVESFIKIYHSQIPRTTLRYATEKFPDAKRRQFLRGEF